MDHRTAMLQAGITSDTRSQGIAGLEDLIAKSMIPVLEKMHSYLGVFDGGRSRDFAGRLARSNFTVREVTQAADQIVETWTDTKAPPYAVFKKFLPRKADQARVDEEIGKNARELQKKTEVLEKEARDKLVTSDDLKKWYKEVYDGSPESYGLTLDLFRPCFLQDMKDANWDLDKAIEIGKTR